MKKKVLALATILCVIILFTGCKKDDEDETPATYEVMQSDLNKASMAEDLSINGIPYGQDVHPVILNHPQTCLWISKKQK